MKTKEKELIKLSKLTAGLSPFTRSTLSLALSNLTLCANSSIPNRENMKMNRNSRIENVATSFRVFTIVSSNSSNRFQVFANLKILLSLNALNAVMTEPVF